MNAIVPIAARDPPAASPRTPDPDAIRAFFVETLDDFRRWSPGYNMHFGYWAPGTNPFDREAMLERLSIEAIASLNLPPATPVKDVSPITFLGQQVVEKHPVVKQWAAGSPGSVPIESMITATRPYSPIERLRLESFYPVVQGYKSAAAYGMHARFWRPRPQRHSRSTGAHPRWACSPEQY